ncbi:hypothetical protein [Amycolatopsis sp. NPDC051128]|uniref:hypothetical protein n=1 Tax=Amycolatopsis sp. NPDC051128 TaxID=3155412 RepID=UPI00342174AB
MARTAPRREQVTVAELLGRSAAPRDRFGSEDTLVLPRARHREKPQVLRSLARLRVISVVAGALALTGGVSAAVSMPVERSAGPARPPAGLEPLPVALVPLPADVVIPPAKVTPESVAPSAEPPVITPAVVDPETNSGSSPGRRGKLARAVQVVGKAKAMAKPKPPRAAAPSVRHEIPEVPMWSRGRPAVPDHQMTFSGRRPAGFPGGGHHGCGGGRHRR